MAVHRSRFNNVNRQYRVTSVEVCRHDLEGWLRNALRTSGRPQLTIVPDIGNAAATQPEKRKRRRRDPRIQGLIAEAVRRVERDGDSARSAAKTIATREWAKDHGLANSLDALGQKIRRGISAAPK